MTSRPAKTRWNAEKLRDILKEKGLSQSDLARRLGVVPQTVSFWVYKTPKDRTEPIFTNLLNMCDFLNVHPKIFDLKDAEKQIVLTCEIHELLLFNGIESAPCENPVDKLYLFCGKRFSLCKNHAKFAARFRRIDSGLK